MKFTLEAYRNGYALIVPVGDRTLPLIDGKTGDVFIFDKRTSFAFAYGGINNEIEIVAKFLARHHHV